MLPFALIVLLGALLALAASAASAQAGGYEVWMTDQNNTAGFSEAAPRGTHGGRLVIHDGDDLDVRRRPVDDPEVLELAELFAVGGPHNATGAAVVRPHMLAPSPDHRYMAVSFVASGHVAIVDADRRRPAALFRMSPGAAGARQAHAAFWTHDGRSLIVANQNGKLLERIDRDPGGGFTHVTGATLDLAGCVTPNGHPCETATPASDADPGYLGLHNRPDNAPICPVITSDDRAYVTLRGGGLLVVDVSRTPMAIVGEYGTSAIGRDGCGGRQDDDDVYLSTGTGTPATNPSEFSVFRFRNAFPGAPGFLAPNTPPAALLFRDATPESPNDAHGMVLTRRSRYLWQFDRLGNAAQVFDARRDPPRHIGGVDLTAPGLSADPTPDIADLSPGGDRIYVALRGPQPQTGAHASAGDTPGLGIVSLRGGGRTGALTHVLRTTSTNPVTGGEESDAHGLAVRLTRRGAAVRFGASGGGQRPTVCDLR
jgi:hypothetical protein